MNDAAVIAEMGTDLARMVRCWFADNPNALVLPRARFIAQFAEAVLAEGAAHEDREPAGEESPLCPARFARYHRGATPQTGRARRRK